MSLRADWRTEKKKVVNIKTVLRDLTKRVSNKRADAQEPVKLVRRSGMYVTGIPEGDKREMEQEKTLKNYWQKLSKLGNDIN